MSQITLICGRCRKPIAAGTGFLGISLAQLREAGAQGKPGPDQAVDIHEFIGTGKDEAQWLTRHYACAPKADADSYQIDSERLTVWPELVWWTAHLMGKAWLELSDWDELLAEVAEGRSERIHVAAAAVA